MGSLRGSRAQEFAACYDEFDDVDELFTRRGRRSRAVDKDGGGTDRRPSSPLRRDVPSEAFKCRRCKAFIGAPATGGRHRNHCPNCLWSLHVDLKTPGDRRSDCRSLMEPVGMAVRRNGEQAVVHTCRGCGVTRHCRVAADDNPLLVMRLPLEGGALRDEEERDEQVVA